MPHIGCDETITDSLGKNSPHGVFHRKNEWVKGPKVIPVDYSTPITSAPGGRRTMLGVGQVYVLASSAWYGTNLNWDTNSKTSVPPRWTIALPNQTTETVLKEQVLSNARQLKADVMLNLVEANQIWPSITSLATALPLMKKHWADRSFRRAIKTASSSYLAWKFGISPILSDMMNVHRYLPKLKADLMRHENEGKRRFSVKTDINAVFDSMPWIRDSYMGIPVNVVSYQGLLVKSPMVRYVLVVEPTSVGKSDFSKKADFFLSRFATSPASLAWERIPFSFVVDWFVDLRGVLRGLDKLVGFEPYKIVSFTRSFTYKTQLDIYNEYRTSCPENTPIANFCAGSSVCSHYERSVVSPDATAPVWRPRFGKNQAGITAALIAQQLSKLSTNRAISQGIGQFNREVDDLIK